MSLPSRARAPAALLLTSLLCCASPAPEPQECLRDQDCGWNEHCVSRRCVSLGVMLDAGLSDGGPPGADAAAHDAALDAAVDAGRTDAGPTDAAPRDATALDATPRRDASALDATTLDATALDATVHDATVHDATVHDASAPDTALPDAALDAGFPDAAPRDSGIRDAGSGPVARGLYDYRRLILPTVPASHELTHAAISPDDRRLVVSERYDVLYLVDVATETSSISVRLPKDSSEPIMVEAIAYARDGSRVLVAATAYVGANHTPEARLFRSGPALDGLVRVGGRTAGRHLQAIVEDDVAGTTSLLGYQDLNGGGYLVAIQRYDDASRSITPLAQDFVSAGCQGADLADDGLGGRGLVFGCGVNGAVVGVYDSTGSFMYGGNTGNTSHVAARPQRDYALLVSWSGGRLSRFDRGVWTLSNAPSLATSSAWNIAFSSDGGRALITGQYLNGSATLREYRHGAYTTNEISDVSIAGFDIAPYLGTTGVNLDDVVWRHGGDCGYIVGGCSNTTGCTRGYLIAFSVLNGRPCP